MCLIKDKLQSNVSKMLIMYVDLVLCLRFYDLVKNLSCNSPLWSQTLF